MGLNSLFKIHHSTLKRPSESFRPEASFSFNWYKKRRIS